MIECFFRPVLRLSACVVLLLCLSGHAQADDQVETTFGALTGAPPELRDCELPEIGPGTVFLENGCRYRRSITIEQSDVVLDCRGATITGMHRRGIVIRPGLRNVTIRDCRLHDTGGILIEGQTPEDDAPARDAARAASSSGVVLEHLTITESYMTGVFVDHYVVGATIRNSIVADGHHVGIYLEHGSQKNTVSGNLIRNNGLFTNQGIRRIGPTRREGLSVDGSAFNLIENNVFDSNAFGGIFHYKNCWEFHTTNPESRPRLQGSDGNIIRGNIFKNMDIGIWVASRQARDLVMWDCGDESPYENPVSLELMMGDRSWGKSDEFLGYRFNPELIAGFVDKRALSPRWPFPMKLRLFEDFAKDNLYQGNCFENLQTGIRIEDDGNVVEDNFFVGDFEYLYLGSPFRAKYLNRPVVGTVIENNRNYSPSGRDFIQNSFLAKGEHNQTVILQPKPSEAGAGAETSCPSG
ncbi:right-handed parallel beta-helix repeat-containing protein [uncultured Roseibium sp.]|uniref:right-handed parallel beta-helix repeat-containing protein n=1 Tax=uncultured Roseibium sp. TaxID=1936171 RepID=UPI00260491E9|nr:right-handed parallel beta-helix repeat-containing protein [uncultured Roseibium sp.]